MTAGACPGIPRSISARPIREAGSPRQPRASAIRTIYRAAASKVKEMKKLKKAPLLNVVWRPVAVASTHAIAGREEEVCDHFPRVNEHSFLTHLARQSWRPSFSSSLQQHQINCRHFLHLFLF